MEYKRDPLDAAIVAARQYGEHLVTFRATGLRQTATGPHAIVKVYYTDPDDGLRYPLESNEFNVARMEQRVKLANASHGMIHNGFKDDFKQQNMRALLREFCDGLAEFDSADVAPVEIKGNVDYRPKHILRPFILEGAGTIIYAPGGSTKSYTAMAMAVSVHNGVSDLWDVRYEPTLYINMERSAQSMAGRLGWVNETLGLAGDSSLFIFHTRGRRFASIHSAIRRFVNEHEIGFVVLDSLSRSGQGDLNENGTANEMMDLLNDIAPSWLAVAHTPASNPNKIFGSTMYLNAADVTVMMQSQRKGNSTGSSYQLMKGNDVAAPPKSFLAFDFEDDRLRRIRRPNPEEFPDLLSADNLSTQELLIQYLRENGAASATEIAEEIGVKRGTVTQTLIRRKGGDFVQLADKKWALLADPEWSE